MKNFKAIQGVTIVLCIVCLMSLSFKMQEAKNSNEKNSIEQKDKLRNPADITVGKLKLDKFLKIYGNIVDDVLKNGFENEESAIMKIDMALGEKGLDIEYLKEMDLSNVDFRKTNLRFINMKEAKLTGSDFSGAEMKFANIKEANLQGANFTGANLENCNIKEAELSNTNFTNANLEGANMKEAMVKGANFKGADMSEVDIHEATGLTVKQLIEAKSLHNAKLPEKIADIIKSNKPKLLK